jgi:four helix bundle protein
MDDDFQDFSFNVNETQKEYDLEERTFRFARDVRDFLKRVKATIINTEYIKQLIRASGSVGSNYIEANEALGKKDFLMHVRISNKEAKESRYWLRLVDIENDKDLENTRDGLIKEAQELKNIFGKIISKSQ